MHKCHVDTFKYKAIEQFYVTQIILKDENTVLPAKMLVLQNCHVPPAALSTTCTACKPEKYQSYKIFK